MSEADNPYAAPTADVILLPVESSDVEHIRKAHISHEASVKSVGCLYYLAAGISCMILLGLLVFTFTNGAAPEAVFVFAVYGFMLVVGIFVGRGLRQLKSWVRIPVGILSAIGLIGFPMGTIINGYILYLLFSRKGSMVFSNEYQEIIRQTPHVKYRTSPVVLVIFIIFILVIVGAIAFSVIR